MDRRTFLASAAALAAAGSSSTGATMPQSPAAHTNDPAPTLRQSVCRWCFGGMSVEALCSAAAKIGYSSVELLGPEEWDIPGKHGMVCAVATNVKSNPIPRGFNRAEHHDSIIEELRERLPLVKAAGIPNQIVFSGNRVGMSDEEGLEHCAAGLRRITPLAEDLGVTIIMELLNSRVDHKDYMCDRTAWGAELVKRVGSPRFKLLYDIYHMQIMEGDVIRTLTANIDAIGHFHTAGVPGRREFDDRQELNYRGICRAIVGAGFKGFLGQEFIPSRSPLESLREAFEVCRA
ncbi:MAG: TIM barrel protein [Phycisphaeraceae bacterium]|nr:TIM barrel protein [Phycisphaeraceae bacterium]